MALISQPATMRSGLRPQGLSVYHWVFFAAFAYYSTISFLSSSLVGVKAEDTQRTGAYVALLVVMVMMGGHNITTHPVPGEAPIERWLMAVGVIVLLSNLLQARLSWTAVVHLGMIVWWILTLQLFGRLSYWRPASTRTVVVIFALAFYGYVIASAYAAREIAATYSIENPVVGGIYFVVACAPFVLLAERKWARHLGTAIWLFSVALSFKRGAMVATSVMLLVFLLSSRGANGARSRVSVVASILVLLSSVFLLSDWVSGGYISRRFTLGELEDGSGRAQIYDVLWSAVREANVRELLLGGGSDATIALVHTGAHNQWLEAMVNFGLLGLIAYSGLVVALIRAAFSAGRQHTPLAAATAAGVAYLVVAGFYSGTLFVHQVFYPMALLGTLHGQTSARRDARLLGEGTNH